MDNKLLCGIAREIITPEVGCELFGYWPGIISTSVHDDLTATAFYFESGDTKAMMISVTVANVRRDTCEMLSSIIESETGVPADNIIIAAIHTHSAPNLIGSVGWGDANEEYLNGIFKNGVLKAARNAKAAMVPVTVGIGQGKSYVGINRRQLKLDNTITLGQCPWGSFDPRMTVISFKNEEGKVIGNMIHYGCHCTASGVNTEITRDWAGPMIDKLEEISGGVTAFFGGAEGDVGPRLPNGKTTGRNTVEDAVLLGGVAASDAVGVWRGIKAWHEAGVDATCGLLKLPLKERITREEAQHSIDAIPATANNLGAAVRNHAKLVLDSYENGYEEQTTRDYPQTVIKIGDVAFVSFGFELFSEISMRIAAASNVPYTLSLANSNGCFGYFPSEDQICRGGYEITMWKTSNVQPYRDDADFSIVTNTLENLEKFKK